MLIPVKMKLAIGLILLGIITYKVMVDYFYSASWPGLIMILVGLVYVSIANLKQRLAVIKTKDRVEMIGMAGAIMLSLGLVSLFGLVFLHDGFQSFYIIYSSVPLIVIGIVLIIIAWLHKLGRY